VITPANTLVRILRGTELNYAGDEVDSDTPVYENVPAFITEMSRPSTNAADSMPRTVRRSVGKFDARADIRAQDRVEDPSTGMIYVVENVSKARPGMYEADRRAELKNVD
jgi:hypothetical protein